MKTPWVEEEELGEELAKASGTSGEPDPTGSRRSSRSLPAAPSLRVVQTGDFAQDTLSSRGANASVQRDLPSLLGVVTGEILVRGNDHAAGRDPPHGNTCGGAASKYLPRRL